MILSKLIPDFLRGFIIRRLLKSKSINLAFGNKVRVNRHNIFHGNNYVGDGSSIGSSELGFASYIASGSDIHYAKVGNYCAIGKHVQICLGKHPVDYVSTHPAFYSLHKQAGFTFVKEQLFEEHEFVDEAKKFVVSIGNDVWIGNNVVIMDGVTIGDGAVVASGAIVTKNVEPYAIVMGQPAKVKKFRFSEDKIKKLLEVKWWDWDVDFIKDNSRAFIKVDDVLKLADEKEKK